MKINHFSSEAIVFPDRIAPSQHETFVVESATDRICFRDNGRVPNIGYARSADSASASPSC
ncbi:hypothetical protein PV334_19835 [Streptomyces sp. ME02-7008A-1]|nr:hypothetical protein [Streptomyces sp. ME02-7008A-1]MDX3303951.1 hypothetical protein [Streptomyces sp. ME02-7008A]